MPQTRPNGRVIKAHKTLSNASQACYWDKNCNIVFDANCDGKIYWTYTGELEDYNTHIDAFNTGGLVAGTRVVPRTCSWIKRNE